MMRNDMRRTAGLCRCATAFLSFLLIAVSSRGQTLEHYLQEAVENNPGVKAQYVAFEAALQQVHQVSSLPDPGLSFGYFISPVETRVGAQKARLTLTQMFPWFGTLAARKDVAANMAQAQYQRFRDAENEIVFKVTAAWYQLYEVKEMLRLQMENVCILTSYKQLALASFSNAESGMVDVIRADLVLDNSRTEILLLKEKIRPLETAFMRLLNRERTDPIIMPETLKIDSIRSTFAPDSIFVKNRLLRAMDLKIEAATAREKVASKQGLPSFGLGLTYTLVDKRADFNMPDNGKDVLMPMISMTLPLFRQKHRAAAETARLQHVEFTLQKKSMQNMLISEFEMAVFNMKRAKQLFTLYENQITRTHRAIDLLQAAFSNSGRNFEDVMRMQQQLLKFKMAKATAAKEYYTALAKQQYISGK